MDHVNKKVYSNFKFLISQLQNLDELTSQCVWRQASLHSCHSIINNKPPFILQRLLVQIIIHKLEKQRLIPKDTTSNSCRLNLPCSLYSRHMGLYILQRCQVSPPSCSLFLNSFSFPPEWNKAASAHHPGLSSNMWLFLSTLQLDCYIYLPWIQQD